MRGSGYVSAPSVFFAGTSKIGPLDGALAYRRWYTSVMAVTITKGNQEGIMQAQSMDQEKKVTSRKAAAVALSPSLLRDAR